MRTFLQAIRYSTTGVFVTGLISVLQGCSLREGALLGLVLLGVQLCGATPLDTLYWTDEGLMRIYRCSVGNGQSCEPELVAVEATFDEFGNDDIAVDLVHGFLYWGTSNSAKGALRRCSIWAAMPCTPETVLENSSGSTPNGVHIDAVNGYVYFVVGDGFVQRCGLGNSLPCVPQTVATFSPGFLRSVAVMDEDVYMARTGGIYRCSMAESLPCALTLWLSGGSPSSLDVDRTRGLLYWTESVTDTVQRCEIGPTKACKPEIVANTGAGLPSAFVVDSARNILYWETNADFIESCQLANNFPCAARRVVQTPGSNVEGAALGP